MRIGLVTDFYHPWVGGPATVVRNLGHGLAARGHAVSVLAPSASGQQTAELDETVRVERARTVPLPFGYHVRTVASPWMPVRRWLTQWKPDVVHVHHPFPLSASAIYCARSMGIPVVATNHTIPESSLWGVRHLGSLYTVACRSLSWWIVHILNQCSYVATPTDTAAQALRALGYRGDVRTISNGVDTGRFSPGPASQDLRISLGLGEGHIVLYTGRLDGEKEMDVWVRAAAEVASRCDVHFLIGGQGTDRAKIERLSNELGVAPRLHFVGYLDDPVFPDLYRLADLYFITSPVELQSISTLEAVASGLPVVAVNAGALPELVHDGENGRLVPPGDWKAAGQALLDLVADGQSRRVMGNVSRELALRHELERSIDAYEALLTQAVDDERRADS